MNLGQMIDPIWVQDRYPERVDRPACQAVTQTQVRTHRRAGMKTLAILKLLAASPTPLTPAEIRRGLHDGTSSADGALYVLLGYLVGKELIGKAEGTALYAVTELGRARLERTS